jgi:hypothetical protein
MDAKMQTNISLKFFSNPFDKRENGEFFFIIYFLALLSATILNDCNAQQGVLLVWGAECSILVFILFFTCPHKRREERYSNMLLLY